MNLTPSGVFLHVLEDLRTVIRDLALATWGCRVNVLRQSPQPSWQPKSSRARSETQKVPSCLADQPSPATVTGPSRPQKPQWPCGTFQAPLFPGRKHVFISSTCLFLTAMLLLLLPRAPFLTFFTQPVSTDL